MKLFFVAGKSDWVKLRIGWLVFEDTPAIADVNTGCKLAAENRAVSSGVGRLVLYPLSAESRFPRERVILLFSEGRQAHKRAISCPSHAIHSRYAATTRARAAYICRANRRAILGIPR